MVKRIVTNIYAENISKAKLFYAEILGLKEMMNQGWILTYGNHSKMDVQISFANEGGNGTPLPDISIEVENVDEIYEKMKSANFKIEYKITDENWGVRRFFVRDPFGKLINILSHQH